MKFNPTHNWLAKILSLLLATAIWFLIKENLESNGGFIEKPPRALPVREK
jgi:hypothetical protein